MRPIEDERLLALEDATMDSVKQLRAFFKYEGDNPNYFRKARIAAGMIGAYARLRASETNRMAVEAALGRLAPGELPSGQARKSA